MLQEDVACHMVSLLSSAWVGLGWQGVVTSSLRGVDPDPVCDTAKKNSEFTFTHHE